MKKLIALLFVVVSIEAFCQHDSTTLRFTYLQEDLAMISALSDIQYIAIECLDKKMRGKKFMMVLDEYENGKRIHRDASNLACKLDTFRMLVGKDTVYHLVDGCQRITFSTEDSIYKIRFAGRLQGGVFKLTEANPGLSQTHTLKGTEDYSLRPVDCSCEGERTIPLRTLTPVIAYTPPFEAGDTIGDYCILGTEDAQNWFKKFGVKHYYIFNLKIE
jgi:hypothetical protein